MLAVWSLIGVKNTRGALSKCFLNLTVMSLPLAALSPVLTVSWPLVSLPSIVALARVAFGLSIGAAVIPAAVCRVLSGGCTAVLMWAAKVPWLLNRVFSLK